MALKSRGKTIPRVLQRARTPQRTGKWISSKGTYLTSPVLSDVIVTPQSALTLTAYYAAINVIATDVAKLPLAVYRDRDNHGHPRDPDPSFYLADKLLWKPNEEQQAFRFRQHAMGHVLGWGNGLTEVVRDRSGRVAALYLLDPAIVQPKRDERTKKLRYEDSRDDLKFLPEDVLHVAGLGYDGLRGYTPAQLLRQAIGLSIGAEQYGASFFGQSGFPGGVLELPTKLTHEATKNLRDSWHQLHGGSQNSRRIAIIGAGTKFTPVQIPPEDAQFLETRKFQILEICRMFRVPPHKLGDFSESHLKNVEESNTEYVSNTLMGWLTAIEYELNLKLLTAEERRTHFIAHSVEHLLRGNMQARGEYYRTLHGLGAMSVDEIRAREALAPIGPERGGEEHWIQSQYIPLSKAMQGQQQDPGADPPAADDGDPLDAHDAQNTEPV